MKLDIFTLMLQSILTYSATICFYNAACIIFKLFLFPSFSCARFMLGHGHDAALYLYMLANCKILYDPR